MAKKNTRNTRASIVDAAWQLFYEQGYEDTTVEEIIAASHTSKGSFYHYFGGKDALLATLSDLFDQKYQDLQPTLDPAMPALDKLLFLNRALFQMIEDRVPLDLLARLLSTQLVTTGARHLLDHRRTYYRLLRQIIAQGQETGQLTRDQSVSDMVKSMPWCERPCSTTGAFAGENTPWPPTPGSRCPRFLAQLLPEIRLVNVYPKSLFPNLSSFSRVAV